MTEQREEVRKRRHPSEVLFDEGVIPPQAIDFEEAVLGAILMDKDAILDVADKLQEEAFYKESHRLIYKACLALFNQGKPIDILTVTQKLRETGEIESAGGAYGVSMLTNKVCGSENIEFHVYTILEKYIQREIIRVSHESIRSAFSEADALKLLEKFNLDGLRMMSIIDSTKNCSVPQVIEDVIRNIDHQRSLDVPSGINIGLSRLNQILGGLEDNLYILAARPGMGKTALMLTIALYLAYDCGIPTEVFSLEMSTGQLMCRALSKLSGVSHYSIKKPYLLTEQELENIRAAAAELKSRPLFIDDTAGMSIAQIRAKSIRAVKEYGVKAIFVDYLQLVTIPYEKGRTREGEVSEISKRLKSLSKELKVPVIALSQLSRKIEERSLSNQRPVLSDLRESGAIEQDADVVMFIYSPNSLDPDMSVVEAEVIVAKNRHGSTGTAKETFNKSLVCFNEDEPQMPLNPGYRVKEDERF